MSTTFTITAKPSSILEEIEASGMEVIRPATADRIVTDEENLIYELRKAQRMITDLLGCILHEQDSGNADLVAPAYNAIRSFADGAGASGTLASTVNRAQHLASSIVARIETGCARKAAEWQS